MPAVSTDPRPCLRILGAFGAHLLGDRRRVPSRDDLVRPHPYGSDTSGVELRSSQAALPSLLLTPVRFPSASKWIILFGARLLISPAASRPVPRTGKVAPAQPRVHLGESPVKCRAVAGSSARWKKRR